jgi:capsular polysaccharide biosynthesis protein
MSTLTLSDLFGTIRRRIVWILVIAVLCAGSALALNLFEREQVVAKSYTAEATIYVFQGVYDEGEPNYSIENLRMIESARRIVVSDKVAGEVRRAYLEQDDSLTINSPYAYDTGIATRIMSFYVYVDATARSPELALAAANEVAERAVEEMRRTFPTFSRAEVFDTAYLRAASGTYAAEPGSDPLVSANAEDLGEVRGSVFSRIDKKAALLALFVGLFGSAFIFCAYELLNRRIRTAHDAEVLIGVPVIAQLDKSSAPGDTSDAEAFDASVGLVASDVEVMLKNLDPKTLAVVSIASNATCEACVTALNRELGSRDATATYTIRSAGSFAEEPKATVTVSDASAALLVTRTNEASSRQIKVAIRQLQIADTPLVGIVLVNR